MTVNYNFYISVHNEYYIKLVESIKRFADKYNYTFKDCGFDRRDESVKFIVVAEYVSKQYHTLLRFADIYDFTLTADFT